MEIRLLGPLRALIDRGEVQLQRRQVRVLLAVLALTRNEPCSSRGSPPTRSAKQVVKAKDRAGFVVNMLLVPYMKEAMRM